MEHKTSDQIDQIQCIEADEEIMCMEADAIEDVKDQCLHGSFKLRS